MESSWHQCMKHLKSVPIICRPNIISTFPVSKNVRTRIRPRVKNEDLIHHWKSHRKQSTDKFYLNQFVSVKKFYWSRVPPTLYLDFYARILCSVRGLKNSYFMRPALLSPNRLQYFSILRISPVSLYHCDCYEDGEHSQ